jgi:DNA-directed RNA polymerase subunit E'/Rpb7
VSRRPFEEVLRSEVRSAHATGDIYAVIPAHLAVHVADLVEAVRRDYRLADDILAAADDGRVLLANERVEVRRQMRELLAKLDEEGCGG